MQTTPSCSTNQTYTLYFTDSELILFLAWLFKTTALEVKIRVLKDCPFPYEKQFPVEAAYNTQ